MKLADALVDTLSAWNVEFVFGVSGANIEHLHDAIHRYGSEKIQSILAKSEVGAAFMADGYARRHNRLGVCCSTSGGGMMNLAVGIAESYSESVPILALIGLPPQELEGKGAFQDSSGEPRSVNALAMCHAIAKFAAKIDDAEMFWPTLAEAVTKALSDRAGPSVLLIPRNVFDLEVNKRPEDFPTDLKALKLTKPASMPDIDDLWQLLTAAERPVLMLGTGVSRSLNGDAVIRFAQTTGIAVVSTMADPGIYPNDLPNYLGIIGSAGHPSAHDYINHQADLIILVGSGLNIMVRGPIIPACHNRSWAVVNVDPDPILRIIKPNSVIDADAGEVFIELLRRHRLSPLRYSIPSNYAITRFTPQLAAKLPDDVDEQSLRQSDAISIIEDHLLGAGNLLFDAGNCAAAAVHYLKIPHHWTTNIALGFGGMGYAIAASIGSQIGDRSLKTVVICGDGAFLMLGLEVHTAIEYDLPILFIVFNNSSHGMCVTRQQVYFQGRLECSSYASFDAAALARSLGQKSNVWTARAKTALDVKKHLSEYFSEKKPRVGVLDLQIDVEEIPPFVPFLPKDAKTFTTPPLTALR